MKCKVYLKVSAQKVKYCKQDYNKIRVNKCYTYFKHISNFSIIIHFLFLLFLHPDKHISDKPQVNLMLFPK